MGNRTLPHKNIIKLILATAVFYVGLFYFSKEVGEKINYFEESATIPKASNTHISKEITQTLNVETGSLTTEKNHESANVKLALLRRIQQQRNSYQKKFTDACEKYQIYCEIIDFNGMNAYQKQFMYLNLTAVVGDFISEHQKFGKPILSVLKKIDILDKKGSPRAYASWSKITMHEQSIGDYKEYFNLVGHEIGHIIDLGSIQGNSREKNQLFTEFKKVKFEIDDPSLKYYALSRIDEQTRKENMNQEHFCSRYGMTNPFEDFAECHNLYLNHNNLFLFMAKRNATMKDKYNFIANLYGGKYIFDDKDNITRLGLDPSRRVWDTTKLDK